MQAIALLAAFSARPGLTWPARTLTGIGVAALAGILAEPVTWGRRPRSWAVAALLPVELASAAALIWAGRRTVMQKRESELLCASSLRSVTWAQQTLAT
jgi:hypothetical protein